MADKTRKSTKTTFSLSIVILNILFSTTNAFSLPKGHKTTSMSTLASSSTSSLTNKKCQQRSVFSQVTCHGEQNRFHNTRHICSVTNSSTDDTDSDNIEKQESKLQQHEGAEMMKFGILISSFTDGILNNQDTTSSASMSSETNTKTSTNTVAKVNTAKLFVQYSIATILTKDIIYQIEEAIETSVKHSPCAGPNIDYINMLEEGDALLSPSFDDDSNMIDELDVDSSMNVKRKQDYIQSLLTYIQRASSVLSTSTPPPIKILYIPTAMYALRKDSQNTPGKQRQRARADGKKKRNELLHFVQHLFADYCDDEKNNCDSDNYDDTVNQKESSLFMNISSVTLDLDDGSIKQPETTLSSSASTTFPTNGYDAFKNWRPHLIYVEGGNTFWLSHCMEKGNWYELIRNACIGGDNDGDNDDHHLHHPTLYIGKSAGAIVAGKYVETATWKEWDDPSVVPNKETYEDWKGSFGLDLAGGVSIFPHMSSDFNDLVMEKSVELDLQVMNEITDVTGIKSIDLDDGKSTSSSSTSYCQNNLYTLEEDDCFLICDEDKSWMSMA